MYEHWTTLQRVIWMKDFEIHLKVLETLNVVDKSKYANLIKHVPTMSQHWVLKIKLLSQGPRNRVQRDHLGLPICFINNNYQLHQTIVPLTPKRPLRIPNIVVSARTPGGANLSIPSQPETHGSPYQWFIYSSSDWKSTQNLHNWKFIPFEAMMMIMIRN